jgi:hypothetical protein
MKRVADLQAYLRLFCHRRALIEIGDHGLAVHFEAADEAAMFSVLWTVWAAAGLVPTSRSTRQAAPNGMGDDTMTLRAKVMLTQNLSAETLDAIRNYLRQFLESRHSIEHFDGQVSIYVQDQADAVLLREHFPELIAKVQWL